MTKDQSVKKLPPAILKDIELKNHARRQVGLSVMRVKIRRCISCGRLFESAGNRTCGCVANKNIQDWGEPVGSVTVG